MITLFQLRMRYAQRKAAKAKKTEEAPRDTRLTPSGRSHSDPELSGTKSSTKKKARDSKPKSTKSKDKKPAEINQHQYAPKLPKHKVAPQNTTPSNNIQHQEAAYTNTLASSTGYEEPPSITIRPATLPPLSMNVQHQGDSISGNQSLFPPDPNPYPLPAIDGDPSYPSHVALYERPAVVPSIAPPTYESATNYTPVCETGGGAPSIYDPPANPMTATGIEAATAFQDSHRHRKLRVKFNTPVSESEEESM